MTTDHPLPGLLTDLGPELRQGLTIPCEEPAVTETNLVQNQLLKASKANQQLFTVKPEHPLFISPDLDTDPAASSFARGGVISR